LVLFIHITRMASNEIVSPSNKIHREVGRAKDLSAPLYIVNLLIHQAAVGTKWQRSFMTDSAVTVRVCSVSQLLTIERCASTVRC